MVPICCIMLGGWPCAEKTSSRCISRMTTKFIALKSGRFHVEGPAGHTWADEFISFRRTVGGNAIVPSSAERPSAPARALAPPSGPSVAGPAVAGCEQRPVAAVHCESPPEEGALGRQEEEESGYGP
jgi:hypothetical protein